jgi:hypothetical protein
VWQRGADFAAVLAAVRAGEIEASDRWALLQDEGALVRAGIAPACDLLELLRALADEREPHVAEVVAAEATFVWRLFPAAAEFARGVLGGLLNRVGLEPAPEEGSRVP